MGQFSWLDCIDKTQIVDNKLVNVYVLVPLDFGGGHIEERCYDGYGHFGGFDIYDLIALWNQKSIDPETFTSCCLRYPEPGSYGGLFTFEKTELREKGISEEEIERLDEEIKNKMYNNALVRYEKERNLLKRFCLSENPKEEFTLDERRQIGILFACYNEDNFKLPYPIKITHNPFVTYEKCSPSLSDPNQGWEEDDEEEYDY